MKKMMIALMVMLLTAATGSAMSYEQARNEALFLTDKMAYELNLTDEQYEAAYEINLDYLMGVTSYDDVFGTYWERRNLDLSYVLLDWQWTAFRAATYFYRPLYWRDGFWHFGIYARYPHRDYFYFGRPVFYASYRGGHAWHTVGGHGYYYGRRDHFRPAAGHTHFGMLDRWNRGDYRNHHHTSPNGSAHHFGGNRNSSTRTTANGSHPGSHNTTQRGNGSLGGYRSQSGGSGNSTLGRPATPATTTTTTTTHSTTSGTTSRPATVTRHPSAATSAVQSGRPSSIESRAAGSSKSLGSSRAGVNGTAAPTHNGGSITRSSGRSAGGSTGGGHSYGGRR